MTKYLVALYPHTMATDQTQTTDSDAPEDPADLLPEHSILTLDEYLAMHAAVGNRTRYEILYRLVHNGAMAPAELEDEMDIDDSTLHYHLNKLVDVGLIEKHQRTERGQDGLHTYYQATVYGRVTLTEGVDELIRGEHSFDNMYNSSSGTAETESESESA
jgi:DNA-binding transcriptional ArsR family regulator